MRATILPSSRSAIRVRHVPGEIEVMRHDEGRYGALRLEAHDHGLDNRGGRRVESRCRLVVQEVAQARGSWPARQPPSASCRRRAPAAWRGRSQSCRRGPGMPAPFSGSRRPGRACGRKAERPRSRKPLIESKSAPSWKSMPVLPLMRSRSLRSAPTTSSPSIVMLPAWEKGAP